MKRIIYFLRGLFVIVLLTGFSNSTLAQLSGSGTSSDPYLIGNLTDLEYISTHASIWNAYFKQTADIDASATSGWNSGQGFYPIGNSTTNFTGNYNGSGHTITGLFINRSTTDYIGLFGYTTNAVIDSMGIVNENITGYTYVGGLAGEIYLTTVSNSYSTGSVNGNYRYTGGLVGYNDASSVISNSYSTVSVSGTNNYIGGLVGESYHATISNSYSTGSVSGASFLGGLVGSNYYSSVSNSYSAGSVNGDSYVGGLVGYHVFSSSISNSYSTGSVSGTGSSIGGLLGLNQATATASF